MTVYLWPPAIIPNASTMDIISNTKTFPSPLTGAVQTQKRAGTRWQLTLELTGQRGADRADLQGFLARLNGQEHRVQIGDHSAQRRGNPGTGVTLQVAASRGANNVQMTGLNPSTVVFEPGDYFDINGELKMAVAKTSSDSGGMASVDFIPELRADYPLGQAVDVTAPEGIFLLADPTIGWANVPGDVNGAQSAFSIILLEDILQQVAQP